MHLILSVKKFMNQTYWAARVGLLLYLSASFKSKLQVASHKPIIWRIRGLGTPKDLFGGGRQQKRPLGAPPTGWCCKTYPEAHTEYATEFAGQTLKTAKSVSSCSEALAHYECQSATLKFKQIEKVRFLFTGKPKPALQSCSDSEKAHDFIATLTGSAPFLTVDVPPKVGVDANSSY
jgi:hypothetical protein